MAYLIESVLLKLGAGQSKLKTASQNIFYK